MSLGKIVASHDDVKINITSGQNDFLVVSNDFRLTSHSYILSLVITLDSR